MFFVAASLSPSLMMLSMSSSPAGWAPPAAAFAWAAEAAAASVAAVAVFAAAAFAAQSGKHSNRSLHWSGGAAVQTPEIGA